MPTDGLVYDFLNSPATIWTTLRAVSIFLVTVLVINIFRRIWRAVKQDTINQKFFKNVLSAFIWVVGILLSLSEFPAFRNATTALLAGSGFAAIIIGLAAQESLGNAFNGMFISIFKPFETGDRIHLVNADITGFVEDITIRHTVIRTFTNSRVIIPNSRISQELIENSNFHNARASNFIDVTITYGSDMAKAEEIIAHVIEKHPDFVDTRTDEQKETLPMVRVFVRALGLYGIELRASMWTETVAVNFAACSDVRRQILTEFEQEGIVIASSKIIDALINKE